MQEMKVWSHSQKDSLEKQMAAHSVFFPGKPHGQRSMVGYSPWGPKRVVHDLAMKQQQQQ